MMIIAEVITPWVGDGLSFETAFRPKIQDDYNVNNRDTTGQPVGELPPRPNLFVIWVDAEDTVVDEVENDSTYYVLWREDNAGEEPPANEFGQLRSFLSQAGVDQSEIDEAIGGSVAGRSRTEITEALKVWLRGLHKA